MLGAAGHARWWILEITDYTDLRLDTGVPFAWLTIFKHKHRELPRPPKGSAWETTNKSQSQLSHGKRLPLVAGLKGKETKKWIFRIKEVNQSKEGKKECVQDETTVDLRRAWMSEKLKRFILLTTYFLKARTIACPALFPRHLMQSIIPEDVK